MTDINRSNTARAMAKAIAYANVQKPELACAWLVQLAREIGVEGELGKGKFDRFTGLKNGPDDEERNAADAARKAAR